MIDLPQPRLFIGGAAIGLIAGVILLALGYNSLAPLGFLVAVVLTILAAIAITTPHVPSIEEIEARQGAAIQAEPESDSQPPTDNDKRPDDEAPDVRG